VSCRNHGLSNVPLIAPTSADERIKMFLYCVSVTGVTGVTGALPDDLEEYSGRIRSRTELPLAVGFGISTPKMVEGVSNMADGVVVGSMILKAIEAVGKEASTEERAEAVRSTIFLNFVSAVTGMAAGLSKPISVQIFPLLLGWSNLMVSNT
jgi:tryptophan synthase alpha subunit